MKQPWLNSPLSDSLFILSPPFFSLLVVLLFPDTFRDGDGMPVMYWLILVVFIDVAHVYSTLYRTYFNSHRLQHLQNLLICVPLLCYLAGVLLYHIDDMLFWSVLAYMAVFHFVRQQYGFMRLYSRFEHRGKASHLIDCLAIYTATIYPLLYWHFDGNRKFSWFIEGDFRIYPSQMLIDVCTWLYMLIISTYLFKEGLFMSRKGAIFNIPRNLLIAGTFLSWYFGIVFFNGDMAFTLLNVVSHGIPYVALIRFFEKKSYEKSPQQSTMMKVAYGKYGLVLFILIIILLAYLEEGLWDGLVWKEHQEVFSLFDFLPQVNDSSLLSLLVPLLALPQATHYVLDGFIWRKNKSELFTGKKV